jgi:hypothetical protein
LDTKPTLEDAVHADFASAGAAAATSSADTNDGTARALKTASDSNDLRMLLTPNKKVLSKKYTILLKQMACHK